MQAVPDTRSVYAERVAQGYFTDIQIDREAITRYGGASAADPADGLLIFGPVKRSSNSGSVSLA
jgi:hypothetical protein